MIVKNSENARNVKTVVDNLMIEDMYLDKNFVQQLIATENEEKSLENLKKEVLHDYGIGL